MTPLDSVATRSSRLLRFYHDHGLLDTVFSGTRAVWERVIPEPHASRFRYRSELVQKAIHPSNEPMLPLWKRLSLARSGYTERLYRAYGFDDGTDAAPYFSEYARKCSRWINEDPTLLSDKERFHDFLHRNGYAHLRPRQFGTIEDGTFFGQHHDAFSDLLEDEGTVVIKGSVGGGGNHVYRCDLVDGDIVVRGKGNREYGLQAALERLGRGVVVEFCEQAEYADRIHPPSANTIRILTMHPGDGDAFIPAAVHRFGTSETGWLDNFSQGGLSAHINLDTGTLSEAAQLGQDRRTRWHHRHPDTNAQLSGVRVPGWPSIAASIRELASDLTDVRYVGWDLLVTEPGSFVIIEGNHFPDPDVIQVHRPLLEDGRVRDFLESHQVPL